MQNSQKGDLFLVSGPSGSGKDTILKQVLAQDPSLRFSISATTRPRREESDDAKYLFLRREQFEADIQKGAFLEYAEYCGNYYGTPAAPIEQWRSEGRDVLVECEIQGARQIMKQAPDLTSIFIMPPSVEVLKKRLMGRSTESEEQMQKRLQTALSEMKEAAAYDYLIINDDLSAAVELFCSIIQTSRARVLRNLKTIDEVLQHA